MKELIDELRACANGHPLDIYAPILTSAADALESQARDIELKNKALVNMQAAWSKLRAEIAALKAQPIGVVLPERSDERGSDGKLTYEAIARNRCLDEVARLNQPASAGDERAAFLQWCEAEQVSPSSETGFMMWESWQARAALSANCSEQVREGWQLVPVEPSVEVLTAMSVAMGVEPLSDGSDGGYPITGRQSTARQVYMAMLAAAPSAGSQGGDV